ncbi:MAG: hypothetical protein AAB455_03570 [Patescibacteria group bacterium]
MTPEQLAQEADRKIREWLVGRDKLVVAIDGYTGVGKTTLLENLVKLNPGILPVHWDDFIISVDDFEQVLKQTEDKSTAFELHQTDHAAIEKLVTTFRGSSENYQTKIFNPQTGQVDAPIEYDFSKKILVIDGVFLFHPKLLDHLWDKRIYLDGDVDEIDRRRVEREQKRWGDKYFPETHPDSHFRQITTALKSYRETYHPEQKADLVLTNIA